MDYEVFEQEFEKLTGIRLDLYKEKQMKRRINTLMGRKGFSDYETFLQHLASDTEELTAFLDYITINVTEFFRTPEQWGCMEADALTGLLQKKEKLKIWSTACATGEEPYSLAISLLRLAEPSRFQILATDLNEKVIRFAREGFYSEKSTEKLPEDILNRFFVRQQYGLSVSDEVKACVAFQKLDLLRDPFPADCDLIVCRNVLIYFTEEAKEQIYLQFQQSLSPGGWLFTGNTEQLIYYKKFGFRKIKGFLYQKDCIQAADVGPDCPNHSEPGLLRQEISGYPVNRQKKIP